MTKLCVWWKCDILAEGYIQAEKTSQCENSTQTSHNFTEANLIDYICNKLEVEALMLLSQVGDTAPVCSDVFTKTSSMKP